jgi:pimeloyl-ACP methyl ester carboxylesterase
MTMFTPRHPARAVHSRRTLGTTLCAAALLCAAAGASAQDLKDVRTPHSPLVLKARGSFYVGGQTVAQTSNQVSFLSFLPFRDDRVTINQMYVEFMVPEGRTKVPMVLVHGATLSGKSYDTTPDGRMGWYEYFVRQGHPVYVPDQVGRARSGFNQAIFNDVAAGLVSPTLQPRFFRLGDDWGGWTNFRFGPQPGVPYADTKYPVAKAGELSKQDIPDINIGLPSPNPTYKALSDLANKVEGAVLVSHSQSGDFPIQAALADPRGIKGMVIIEPGGCMGGLVPNYTDQQIAQLAKIPTLVVFGDNVGQDTGTPLTFLWQDSFNGCKAFIARLNAAGGNAQMLWPPALGIYGNSHMIMQDTNNRQIGDMILGWIERNVHERKRHSN